MKADTMFLINRKKCTKKQSEKNTQKKRQNVK